MRALILFVAAHEGAEIGQGDQEVRPLQLAAQVLGHGFEGMVVKDLGWV